MSSSSPTELYTLVSLAPDVPEPPYFVNGLQPIIARDGDLVTLRCKVIGRPQPPEAVWYHGTKLVDDKSDFITRYDTDTGECVLIIVECMPEDTGLFTCRAKNPSGEAVTSAGLLVQEEDRRETKEQFESEVTSETSYKYIETVAIYQTKEEKEKARVLPKDRKHFQIIQTVVCEPRDVELSPPHGDVITRDGDLISPLGDVTLPESGAMPLERDVTPSHTRYRTIYREDLMSDADLPEVAFTIALPGHRISVPSRSQEDLRSETETENEVEIRAVAEAQSLGQRYKETIVRKPEPKPVQFFASMPSAQEISVTHKAVVSTNIKPTEFMIKSPDVQELKLVVPEMATSTKIMKPKEIELKQDVQRPKESIPEPEELLFTPSKVLPFMSEVPDLSEVELHKPEPKVLVSSKSPPREEVKLQKHDGRKVPLILTESESEVEVAERAPRKPRRGADKYHTTPEKYRTTPEKYRTTHHEEIVSEGELPEVAFTVHLPSGHISSSLESLREQQQLKAPQLHRPRSQEDLLTETETESEMEATESLLEKEERRRGPDYQERIQRETNRGPINIEIAYQSGSEGEIANMVKSTFETDVKSEPGRKAVNIKDHKPEVNLYYVVEPVTDDEERQTKDEKQTEEEKSTTDESKKSTVRTVNVERADETLSTKPRSQQPRNVIIEYPVTDSDSGFRETSSYSRTVKREHSHQSSYSETMETSGGEKRTVYEESGPESYSDTEHIHIDRSLLLPEQQSKHTKKQERSKKASYEVVIKPDIVHTVPKEHITIKGADTSTATTVTVKGTDTRSSTKTDKELRSERKETQTHKETVYVEEHGPDMYSDSEHVHIDRSLSLPSSEQPDKKPAQTPHQRSSYDTNVRPTITQEIPVLHVPTPDSRQGSTESSPSDSTSVQTVIHTDTQTRRSYDHSTMPTFTIEVATEPGHTVTCEESGTTDSSHTTDRRESVTKSVTETSTKSRKSKKVTSKKDTVIFIPSTTGEREDKTPSPSSLMPPSDLPDTPPYTRKQHRVIQIPVHVQPEHEDTGTAGTQRKTVTKTEMVKTEQMDVGKLTDAESDLETQKPSTPVVLSKEGQEVINRQILEHGGSASTAGATILADKSLELMPPHFVVPIEPQIVREGQTCTLRARVTGVPMPEVRWYKELSRAGPIKRARSVMDQDVKTLALEITPSERVTQTYNKDTGDISLVLADCTTEDGGNISCVATNCVGRATCTANMIIVREYRHIPM